MATAPFVQLSGANLSGTVVDNLKPGSLGQAFISDALNSALRSQLSASLTKAGLLVIAGLVEQMTSADLVAANSLSIQAFTKQQLDSMVARDPAKQQAVDGELAKLSDTTTIGSLLQLNTPLQDHPLFKADVMKADIASLLATSPALGQNQQIQVDFISRYAASTGTIQEFWNQLSNDPEFKAAVPELQFTLQLGTLTLNNAPLVAAIRKQDQPKILRDLTALTTNDWTQLITSSNISIPNSVPGNTPAEKTTNYVNGVMGALQSTFPTDYITQNLAANPYDKFDQDVAQFLKSTPQFDLISTNLQQYLGKNPKALGWVPQEDQSTLLRRINGYQRLTRLNSNPQVVSALMSKGLDSAYKISSLPRTGFLSQYSQLLGSSDRAQAVYESAQRTTAATLNFYTTIREGLSNIHPWVFGNVSQEVSAAVQQIPDWQELFGPMSTCACQECRSVLGAAAYFVDLLHFLSNAHINPSDPNSTTLYTILTGRRPDLADLKLNCENTNTTLPYVDLVNEILESVVLTHVGDPPRPPAHNTAADATPDELSVNPEFTNDAAYKSLGDAFYPFTLPFDHSLTIARNYLEFAGSSLYEVMKVFQIGVDPAVPANSNPNPTPSDQAIALEYLKISSSEFLILTGQPFQGTSPLTDLNDLSRYYGYDPLRPPADWVTDLASVPSFLQRTGISYDDLVALLETHFLNPDQQMTLQAPDPNNLCDINSSIILNLLPRNVDRPDLGAVHKIYRFIRLYTKLGWSVPDLDLAISALAAADIDEPLLLKLSPVKKLQDQLNLSVPEVLALWADINTEGADSLYLSLFQNKGSLNPLDPDFALRYTYTLPANISPIDLSILKPFAAQISWATGSLQLKDGNLAPIQMTANQKRFLLSLSSDPSYQEAVKQLFLQNPAPLPTPPQGLTLPKQLPDAIYYEGEQLYSIGQMSDDLRTQLKSLLPDPNYQRAIDNLYAMRRAPDTEVAIAKQVLASQPGQLIPAQMIGAHSNAFLAALRIPGADLAAIVESLWSQSPLPAVVVNPSGLGGALATGTYYVKVSVVDDFGEWLYSKESSAIRVTGPGGSNGVLWPAAPGAKSYYVYYTAADAGPGNETIKITSPTPGQNISTTTIGGAVLTGTAPANLSYPLNLANLSAIYRYASLARALGVSAQDLLSLIQLIGINPFLPPTPGTPGTVQFVAKALELFQSKFSVAQLNYIYRNMQIPSAGLGLQQSDLDQFVSSLQSSLTSPPTEASRAIDPTGSLLELYLGKVLEASDVSQAMDLIRGTFQSSAPLTALPPISFPPSFSFITFDNVNKLTFTGPMSLQRETLLLSLSQDGGYRTAIQTLFGNTQAEWSTVYTSSSSATALPIVVFPPVFASLIAYTNGNTQLTFKGPMSDDQRKQLLSLSSDASYQSAITDLFTQTSAVWTTLHSYGLASLPPITFPDSSPNSLASRLQPGGGNLKLTGALSDADAAKLLGLSADSEYQKAIQTLYLQPRQFILNKLFFLDAKGLIAKLINDPTASLSDKFGFVLNALLNSIGLVVQAVSSSLKLDAAVVRRLLVGEQNSSARALLSSRSDPNLDAIVDFFALLGNGLSATYCPSSNFGGTPQFSDVEPSIDFNWSPASPPSPGMTGNNFSAKWTGAVLAQFTETYTFYLRVVTSPLDTPAFANPPGSFTLRVGGTDLPLKQAQPGGSATASPTLTPIPSGTVTTNGAVISLWSGATFDPSWVAATISINGLSYTVESVQSSTSLKIVDDAGIQAPAVPFYVTGLAVEYTATVPMVAGVLTPIELDYPNAPACTLSSLQLSWSSVSTPKSIIQQHQFYSDSTFTFAEPLCTFVLLCRIALLVSTFRITVDDLSYLSANGSSFAGVDPNDPNNPAKAVPFDLNKYPANASSYVPALFNQWERLLALFTLRDRLSGGDSGLLALFEIAGSLAPPSGSALVSAIAAATGWDAAELGVLVVSQSDPLTPAAIGFGLTAGDFVDERWLVRLQSCIALTARFADSSRHLFEWATLGLNPVTEPNIARDIQAAVKAKYDDATWVKVGKSLNDKLREASRDALVAYILAPPAKWELAVDSITTPDQLYEYFLIDVEMGSCMLTSRMVQATAAVQLFVQRCLMNLEQGISPAAIDTTAWEWMKNYRVWQANREVFLYPENWIEPTLRDDKTPFFRDLENELQQNEITSDTIEQALRNYLEKLHEVARLEVCGIYWQFDSSLPMLPDGTPDVSNDVLHVFARTFGTPSIYFYRRLLNASDYGTEASRSRWTPWERVDLDIQGDHLIPVVWNRSLRLFWPIFSSSSDPNNPAPSGAPPNTMLTVKLAWSDYKQNKWSAKQVSIDGLIPFFGNGGFPVQAQYRMSQDITSLPQGWTTPASKVDVRWLTFQPWQVDDTLSIYMYIDTWTLNDANYGPIPLVYGPDSGRITAPFTAPFYPQLGADGITPVLPQTGVWEEGAFDFTSCRGKLNLSGVSVNLPIPYSTIASATYSYQDFPYATITGVEIPPNSVFEYMWLRQIAPSPGTFSLEWIGQATPISVLGATPAPYLLAIDQGFSSAQITNPPGFFIPNWIVSDASYFQPFFYQDDDKVYFVDITSALPNLVDSATLAYSANQLTRTTAAAQSTLSAAANLSLVLKIAATPVASGPEPIPTILTSPLSESAHTRLMRSTTTPVPAGINVPRIQFSTHFHPHLCAFIQAISQYGVPGLLNLDIQRLPGGDSSVPAFQAYAPDLTYVIRPYPTEHVDFSPLGAYSAYNWELFFHIPLLIATKLSQNQKFEEAQKWFHYIFNPTTNSPDPVPQRFWNFLPFYECSASNEIEGSIENLLAQLDNLAIFSLSIVSGPAGTPVVIRGVNFGAAQGASTVTFNGIAATPVPSGWSDTQIAVTVPSGPATGNVVVTVNGIASNGVPFAIGPTVTAFQPSECGQDVESQVSQWRLNPFDPFLIARMRTIAFRKCVVMKYLDNLIAWGDYLFSQNTRESINEATQIYVLAQQILGDKPVMIPTLGTIQDYSYQDLLTKGLDDFSNALAALENTFPFSTGASIPAGGAGTGLFNGVGARSFYFCIPTNDQFLGYWDTVADRLYKIRHCMNIKGVVEQLPLFAPSINPALLVQATAMGIDLNSVLNEINSPTPNYRFSFMLQKALEVCTEVRSLGGALLSALEKNDAEDLSVLRSTQEISLLQAVVQIKQSQVEEAGDNLAALQASQAVTQQRQTYYQGLIAAGLSAFEKGQVLALTEAQIFKTIGQSIQLLAPVGDATPDATFGGAGAASSPVALVTYGGRNLAAGASDASQALTMLSDVFSFIATMVSLMGQWSRRSEEWNFQLETATKELTQIQSQIDAASVRTQIAVADLENQKLQITNAQAVLDFLNSKYTNQELYGWMVSQISALYFRCYQMAYGLAKRAESCLRFELGLKDSNFIQFGYWDSLRRGLLAGERLYSDLKRMEVAYLDQNTREYEITKNISLVLLDPIALITLKETGQCMISLSEALFDMDYPGQYMRRIKSLSVTIPCVTGPYTSVNCKLALVSSQIRADSMANSPQDYSQDSHFITNFAATQSIATSSAQNDSGMFELSFRDERYLPFEGAGVISQWFIQLPQDCNAFDFETISDVVINLKYTARDGGDGLRAVAKQAAVLPVPSDQGAISTNPTAFPKQNNLVRLFSLRHEFPTEWYKFLNPLSADASQNMLLALTKERFPFQYLGRKISVSQVDLLLKFKDIYDSQQFTTGTPLGDFVNGQGAPSLLNVYVSQAAFSMGQPPQPPTQPTGLTQMSLTSTAVTFNGAPYRSSTVSLNLGSWWLQVFKDAASLGTIPQTLLDANGHLLPGAIDDILMVCHYSAT